MTNKLELGQRVYDACFAIRSEGVIVARRIHDDLQVLAGFETDTRVLHMAKMFLDKPTERILIADSGEVYYTWEGDEDITEIL